MQEIKYARGTFELTKIAISNYRKDGSPGRERRTGRVDTAGNTTDVDKVFGYDNFGRLTSELITRNAAVVHNETYAYSPNGRLLSVTPGSGTKTDYLYQRPDMPGAVTALKVGATTQRTLAYDLAGGIATDTAGSTVKNAAFAANGCLTRLAVASGAELNQVCDVAGNAILRTSKPTAVSVERRILQLGLSELRHDENLLLHRLPVSGTVALELAYKTNVSANNRDAANSRIVMSDLRGSVVAVAPLLGTGAPSTSAARDFDAWGKEITTTTSSKPKHAFVGFEPDTAFGTYAFGRRLYDPALRRWLSADPLVSAVPTVDGSLGQLDLFGYSGANPVRMSDPTGGYADAVAEAVSIGMSAKAISDWDAETTTTTKAVDVVALVADVVLAALPLVPGVVGVAIHGAGKLDEVAGAGLDAAKTLEKVDDASDAKKLLPENAGPVGQISPSEVLNKTPAEIDEAAKRIGLQPKGTDPMNGKGSYIDPKTKQQRIISSPKGDKMNKKPHGHVNTPEGQRVGPDGKVVADDTPEAHLPIKTK